METNKKAVVAMLKPDKIDFKRKAITDEELSSSTSGYLSKETRNTELKKPTYICMLISTLFTITKIWKQPKCSSRDEWIKNWYIYTVEYDSAIKKDGIFPSATTWVDLESIVLIPGTMNVSC